MRPVSMRFGNFVFPVNPSQIVVKNQQSVSVIALPYAGNVLQNTGRTPRIISGTGEFLGRDGDGHFARLHKLFTEAEEKPLLIPGVPPMTAVLHKLQMTCDPVPELIRYSFEFVEKQDESFDSDLEKRFHTVCGEESLFRIAAIHKISVEELMRLNPQRSSPFQTADGERVRIR